MSRLWIGVGKEHGLPTGGVDNVVGGFGACWRDRSRRKMARNSSLIPGCNCEELRRVEIHGSDVLSDVRSPSKGGP